MTVDELRRIIIAVISDDSYLPTHRIIMDAMQTQIIPRSGDVLQIARLFKKHEDVFCPKTALIAKGGLHRDMMELILVLIRANTNIQIELFGNTEAAVMWLDEPQPSESA